MLQITKTDMTIELEKGIYKTTDKMGTFGCFEVTIGWFGYERVDYITYDTKGIWRCYETKHSNPKTQEYKLTGEELEYYRSLPKPEGKKPINTNLRMGDKPC